MAIPPLPQILRSIPDGIAVLNAVGMVVYANVALQEITGVDSLQDLLRPIREYPALLKIRHPDGRPVRPEEMAATQALKGRRIRQFITHIRNLRTDRGKLVSVSSAPIHPPDGGIQGAVVVVRDITPEEAAASVPDAVEGAVRFTRREEEIIRLVARGYRSRQIADRLGIALKTVETHRFHLREKGLTSTSLIVLFALRKGWISAEDFPDLPQTP